MHPKVLATDLDGTLFYPKHINRCVSKKNIAYLRKWIDEGNKLVLVTSRSEEFIQKVVKEIDRDVDLIVCNSAKIIADKKVIRDVSVPTETIKKILHDIKEKYLPTAYLMTSNHYPLIIRDNILLGKFLVFFYKLWWRCQFVYREHFVYNNELFNKELDEGDIYKVIVFFGLAHKKMQFSKDLNKIFLKEYKDVEFSWISQVIELTPKDCNKGKGLKYYCEHLGIDKKDVYVIGDSGNDITMFNEFKENSFVMRHALPSVKKYASKVVPRVHSLEKYILNKKEI